DKVTTDGPFIVTASTTSGLSLDYNISSGPASISGPTVTLDGTSGTVVVSVSQVGNVNYNNATETASFNVNDPAKMDQTISFPAIADKTFGDQQFNLSATSTSGLPVTYSVVSGPVSVSGATISINGAGVATIAANQSGDASFNPAMEMTQSFTIGKADQVITIESIADKGLEDDPFEISVSVDSSLPLTHEVVGPANISGTTITLTGSLGLVTVTSSQAGDANHNPVSASTSFNVVEFAKMDQTITFEKIQDKVFGETFSLIATASSGLDISYGVVSGPITVVGSTVTITGTGTAIIAANQSGNGDFNPATEATQTFTVSKAEQAISLTDIDPKFTNDEPFSVTAMVDSGLELEYNVSGPASISGTTLTLDGTVGIVTVTVSQAGNENYASASLSTTFEVVERPLGVEDDLLEIKFYPNPATDFLIIESTASISVRLFDLNGKIIQQDLSQTGKIDVRNVLPGVYLLEITSDHGIVQKRIVKAN
ncbi:MAG: T9SS type A sorting domain-containing protein, partial [Cyclobacteriaceae bacterium]